MSAPEPGLARLRALMAADAPIANGWCALPAALSAELQAAKGLDAVTLDLQHGMIDQASALAMLTALATCPVGRLVRLSALDPAQAMWVLDAGAHGVICPMINSAAQARALVGACRYPPRGYRSFGPTRAALHLGAAYPAWADSQLLVLAMIETREGLANLDEILAVEGLDGIYIGPVDLGLALGLPARLDSDEPLLLETLAAIAAKARAAGRLLGLHCGGGAYAARMVSRGFRLLTIASDVRLIAAGAEASLAAFRSGGEGAAPGRGTSYP